MNANFKPNERELVKVATYFKKRSRQLIASGKLPEESRNVEEAVDRFVGYLEQHADSRAAILAQRNELRGMVRDDAECPSCNTRDMLKLVGTEANEKGWKSNRYKCRRCNIAFTWNRPNNPWDLVAWFEEVVATLRLKSANPDTTAEEQHNLTNGIDQLNGYLEKLKPVLDAHDREYNDFLGREEEMEKLVHEFRNSLLIEKIKLDSWDKQ